MNVSVSPANWRDFVTSTRGQASGPQSLSLGLVTGALTGLAVVLGSADRAQADYCYGIPEGQDGNACDVSDQCYTNPPTHYYSTFHHYPDPTGCQFVSHIGCYCS